MSLRKPSFASFSLALLALLLLVVALVADFAAEAAGCVVDFSDVFAIGLVNWEPVVATGGGSVSAHALGSSAAMGVKW